MPIETLTSPPEKIPLRPQKGWPPKYEDQPLKKKLTVGSLGGSPFLADSLRRLTPPATTTSTPLQTLPKPGK